MSTGSAAGVAVGGFDPTGDTAIAGAAIPAGRSIAGGTNMRAAAISLVLLIAASLPALAQVRQPTCPRDKVVWVNTRTHIYHFQGERYFGRTKQGKFMCEHAADREGDRPSRNGQ